MIISEKERWRDGWVSFVQGLMWMGMGKVEAGGTGCGDLCDGDLEPIFRDRTGSGVGEFGEDVNDRVGVGGSRYSEGDGNGGVGDEELIGGGEGGGVVWKSGAEAPVVVCGGAVGLCGRGLRLREVD